MSVAKQHACHLIISWLLVVPHHSPRRFRKNTMYVLRDNVLVQRWMQTQQVKIIVRLIFVELNGKQTHNNATLGETALYDRW